MISAMTGNPPLYQNCTVRSNLYHNDITGDELVKGLSVDISQSIKKQRYKVLVCESIARVFLLLAFQQECFNILQPKCRFIRSTFFIDLKLSN